MADYRVPSPLAREALAYVLAGGRGTRLVELTDRRAKPAVYFGGKSRIIDFALSNAINSGIRRISVATQYQAHSLIRHLQRGWNFLRPERNESFDVLPASQRVREDMWYAGTADAVYQNMDIIEDYGPRYIVILAGDHIYKMDYGALLLDHIDRKADVTVPCIAVPRDQASGFGVMHIDEDRRIIDFVEKPADPPPMPGRPDMALASMGIYVFNAQFLYEQLERDVTTPGSSRDFGKDIIPHLVKSGARIIAHDYADSAVIDAPDDAPYWRDVGTIDAYWEANLDLCHVTPQLNLYNRDWPIFTYQEQLPPAKFVFDDENRRGMAVDSLVSGGCIISGSTVRRSLLFSSVRVNSYSELHEAVVLPECDIGRHCRLKKVVIDRGVSIPNGLVVGEDAELDAKRFHRSEGGVVLITREMIEKLPKE